jgi:hypothetical protein
MSRRFSILTCALMCAAIAPAASASAATKAPVIKTISPLKLKVGEKLTVNGNYFLRGKNKTRVFFLRKGGGTAFARAQKATKTKLTVTVPAQLDKVLNGKSARIQIRVLTSKFGKVSVSRKSPVISPSAGGSDGGGSDGGGSNPGADCDKDGVPNSADTDDDNDLLSDTDEVSFATDPCAADTDLDGVEDGYEYFSALDLNRTVLFGSRPPTPYPGKRPYPNPLFPDAGTDFDGDGLALIDESTLWKKFGGHQLPLNYSDGTQTTVPTDAPDDEILLQLDSAPFGPHYADRQLDDGERDADGDGLTNWDESHGRLTPEWWISAYDGTVGRKETPYPITYAGTDMLDNDTDGDGVLDGPDDQDHDGLANWFEVARPIDWTDTYISIGPASPHDGTGEDGTATPNPYARTQPFNPCKPVYSETCHNHPPFAYYDQQEDWAGRYPSSIPAPGVTPGPILP